jgi:hypothetical protein
MNSQSTARMLAASFCMVSVLTGISTVFGHGLMPVDAPVARLVANLTEFVKEHPDDPDGYYRLGRVHTLALETGTGFVRVFEREGQTLQPAEGSWAKPGAWEEQKPKTATAEQLAVHLKLAIQNLNKAIELRPNSARYRLTLACALEAGTSMITTTDAWPLCPVPKVAGENKDPVWLLKDTREQFERARKDPSALENVIARLSGPDWGRHSRDITVTIAHQHRDIPEYKDIAEKIRVADWNVQITEQYFTAMCLALPSDGKAEQLPIWGGMEDWISFEAGSNFVRVVEARGPQPTEAVRLKVAKATVQAFKELPHPKAITPIVFGLRAGSLSDLIGDTQVDFDLDGTARPQSWQWVNPDTAILVWDPEANGRITSGRQLFGSVSWWLFFDDGYQALDALDDNRDGHLSGSELIGIAAWSDRNSDGVSGPGEVQPVTTLGVSVISCRATGFAGASPANQAGIEMTDGRLLPTYDWISAGRPSRRVGQQCSSEGHNGLFLAE